MFEEDKEDLADLLRLVAKAMKCLHDAEGDELGVVDAPVPFTGSDVVRLASAVVVAKELRGVWKALDHLGINMRR